MITTIHGIKIRGTGSFVPPMRVSSASLNPASADYVTRVLGIRERRRLLLHESLSDIATQAAVRACHMAELATHSIGLVIAGTSSPDNAAPSLASTVQGNLGIRGPAMDVNAVCGGFIYAFVTAATLMQSMPEISHALVIGADAYSRITDYTHRDCVFFGDGAGAVILSRHDDEHYPMVVGLDGAPDGVCAFVAPRNGTFQMKGAQVSFAAQQYVPTFLRELLRYMTGPVDHWVLHQGSKVLFDAVHQMLPEDGTKHTHMDRYGNTAAASVPLLLDELVRSRTIRPGQRVVLGSFGAGWAWGGAVMDLPVMGAL